jgi:Ca-activated chloride channel family protein
MPRAQADEPALRRIAEVTGGRYFRATDTASLVTIYEEIDQLERRTTGERTYRDNTRAARTAMLLGLGCLSAELLLVSTRFRRVP